MREIKLTGRERAAIKAIDFSIGCTGDEIHERTKIAPDELLEMLNGLSDAGYLEAYNADDKPLLTHATNEQFSTTRFEVNPSYVQELKEALRR